MLYQKVSFSWTGSCWHRSLQGAKFEKNEKFPAKVFKFFFKLADWNGDFGPNLNQVIYYLNCVKYSKNSILMQKLDQTFIKPSKFLDKFFVKIYIWANSHLLKT